jgi:hypothetical protein
MTTSSKTNNKSKKGEIKKLLNHRSVKLSSTLAGQRELLREIKNKINEIIDKLNA